MKVLYVAAVTEETPAWRELSRVDPALEIQVASGAAAALTGLRAGHGHRAVFLSPHLPPNEALALIATLRRDRVPIAIVAIITRAQRQFFAPAITAGADDVLVMQEDGLFAGDETLRRVRHSRHLDRSDDLSALRVLFVGRDDLAWHLLADIPFIVAEQATAAADGSCPTSMALSGVPADAIIIDEDPGDSHALEVVRWLKANAPRVPIVAMTSPAGSDLGGAALDMGADDVVSKVGSYARRLVAALHKHYLRKASAGTTGTTGATGTPGPFEPVAAPPAEPIETAFEIEDDVRDDAPDEPSRPDPDEVAAAEAEAKAQVEATAQADAEAEAQAEAENIRRIREALAAEARIRDLTAEVQSLGVTLATRQKAFEELAETQGFERAMRDRDRDELTKLRQSLADERERRIVLEGTLSQTEDRAASEVAALDAKHAAATRQLESQLALAADRLHEVANQTQVLQTRLQNELTAQAAERGRLIANDLFGYATLTIEGELVTCNMAFARMFGFEDVGDAVAASAPAFDWLADHAHVVGRLQSGLAIDRTESVMRRENGRAFRVLTSAALLPAQGDSPTLVERLFVDLDDRTQLEEQLRLARRLESAGRLAAEMSGEIESVLPSLDAASPAQVRAVTLVRQLLSYSRKLAKPAGQLSLYDAIRRSEPHLRQIAGDGITFELRLEDVGLISASEDDLEQLLSALVFAAAASLPYGGTIALETRSVRSGFDQHTELAVAAIGYGVHSASLSSSLARLVTRCGGTVRVSDDPARATTLLVHLPC